MSTRWLLLIFLVQGTSAWAQNALNEVPPPATAPPPVPSPARMSSPVNPMLQKNPALASPSLRNRGSSNRRNIIPLQTSSTSGVKQNSIRTATVMDEILVDYGKATSFADFMRSMGPRVLPGDDVFLGKKIHDMPELLKVKKMPTLTYEVGNITIRSGKSETLIRALDLDNLDFEVNHQKLAMPSYASAGVRWNRLSEAMMQGQQQSWISLMPVVFAVENGNLPTISGLMAFSILSRISRAISKLDVQVLVDENSFPYSEIWEKSIELKSRCSSSYMMSLAQKLAEIGVSTLTCNDKVAAFELPISEDTSRLYKVNAKKYLVEVSGFGLENPITYSRDYSRDQYLDYINQKRPKIVDLKTNQQKREFAKKFKVARMKGLKLKPIGEVSDEDLDAGEHIRELTNTIISGNLCGRCGAFFKSAARVIRQETEPDPSGKPTPGEATAPRQ